MMKLRDAFGYMVSRWTDELVVTSAGHSSGMWWDLTHDRDRVFFLTASMSLSSMFASGIAVGNPGTNVWAMSGDGAFVMNPGMLFVERVAGIVRVPGIFRGDRQHLPQQRVVDVAGFHAVRETAGHTQRESRRHGRQGRLWRDAEVIQQCLDRGEATGQRRLPGRRVSRRIQSRYHSRRLFISIA